MGGLGAVLFKIAGENWGLAIGAIIALAFIGYAVNKENPTKGLEDALGTGMLIVIAGLVLLFIFGRG